MAGGQLWRLVLDSWGIAGIGVAAAVAAITRRGVPTDLRAMASLLVGVTVLIACAAAAALGPHQSETWASGRYLDGMTVTFFLVGAVVLLRAAARPIRDVTPGVPDPVAAVVMRGLATNPAQRFPTAESFGVALAGAGTEAWGPGWLSAEQVPILGAEPIVSAAGPPAAPRPAPPPTIRPGPLPVPQERESALSYAVTSGSEGASASGKTAGLKPAGAVSESAVVVASQDPARRRGLIIAAVIVAVILIATLAILLLPKMFKVYGSTSSSGAWHAPSITASVR